MTETGHQFADQHTLPEKGPVLAAYRELHVEQGPLLERQDVPIGVVVGIVGIEHGTMHFTGRANHAGTTPMGMGQDAALGVARGVVEARRLVIEHELRATVSHSFRVAPTHRTPYSGGGSFSLDAGRQKNAVLDGYLEALAGSCQQIAHREDLDFAYEQLLSVSPVPLDNDARSARRSVCR